MEVCWYKREPCTPKYTLPECAKSHRIELANNKPENADQQTPWYRSRQVLMIFEPLFPTTRNRKSHLSYQGVHAEKEQESGEDWLEVIEQQEHTLVAAVNGKGTSGGHQNHNSNCTERKPFSTIEVGVMDCREQQTADSFKEFHAVPFRPQFLIITVF